MELILPTHDPAFIQFIPPGENSGPLMTMEGKLLQTRIIPCKNKENVYNYTGECINQAICIDKFKEEAERERK